MSGREVLARDTIDDDLVVTTTVTTSERVALIGPPATHVTTVYGSDGRVAGRELAACERDGLENHDATLALLRRCAPSRRHR